LQTIVIIILVLIIIFQEYVIIRQGIDLKLYKAKEKKFDAEIALFEAKNKLINVKLRQIFEDRGLVYEEDRPTFH